MKNSIVKNPRTEADVQRLMTVFADLIPDGRIVTHQQVEVVLQLSHLSSRYRTITNRWRRTLFTERRVWLDGRTAEGAGFIALTPDGMVRFGNRGVRSAGRQLKRSLAVLSAPKDEELSAQNLHYRHLLQSAVAKMAQDHRAALRDITKALPPMKQLPRVAQG